MKTTINLFAMLFLAATVSLTSCKKEGCTDPDSINYDEKAKKDDGSCAYEGSVVFWYGKSTSEFLINDNATSLTFYVDGDIIRSTATNVYWTSSPDCSDNSSITATMDLGNAKSLAYSYSIVDDTGFEYWKGTANFVANTCVAYELE